MASIYKRGGKWRAEVRTRGVYISDTFRTKRLAEVWAAGQEEDIELRRLGLATRKTLRDAFDRYSKEICPRKKRWRQEQLRLKNILSTVSFADRPLVDIQAGDWGNWRDTRGLSDGTKIRDFSLIRNVYTVLVEEWGWLPTSPLKKLKNPPQPRGRERTWRDSQVTAMLDALGWPGLGEVRQRVAAAFLLALETGMRQGEIFDLVPERVFLEERYVRLEDSKNGDARDVPLSSRAAEILGLVLAEGHDPVFGVNGPSGGALFAKYRPASCDGLTFHDSRHTAATRLGASGKLTPFELCRMFGWRDMKTALRYFNAHATSIAAKLD